MKETIFNILLAVLAGLEVFFLIIIIAVIITKPEPEAIDVYRGLTTLQITYKDSIPLDTIVVWR